MKLRLKVFLSTLRHKFVPGWRNQKPVARYQKIWCLVSGYWLLKLRTSLQNGVLSAFFFLLVAFTLIVTPVDRQAAEAHLLFIHPPPPPLRLADINVGERAEISFRWLGMLVGRGSVHLKERIQHRSREAWHVVVEVRTTRVLDFIFPVRDEYHSFVDVETLESLRFEKIISEGTYRADEVVEFDHEKKEAYYFSRLNKSEKRFKLPSLIHDPISAVYWFRSLVPFRVGEQVHVPVNYEEDNWKVVVPAVGKEDIDAGEMGKKNAIVLKPYIANLTEHVEEWNDEQRKMLLGSRITVWVEEFDGRVPLRISVKVPLIGSVKISVDDYRRVGKTSQQQDAAVGFERQIASSRAQFPIKQV